MGRNKRRCMAQPAFKHIIMAVLLGMVFMLVTVSSADAYERYNRVVKFDPYFRKYTKRFFGPGFDWRHFKAQAVAESRLRADAMSRVGAVGVMQIMPRTFKEILKKKSHHQGQGRPAALEYRRGDLLRPAHLEGLESRTLLSGPPELHLRRLQCR